MKTFNVLENQAPILSSMSLTASAGTGKTFSIENIVTRKLIESPTINIENILVVTFTKAAASELKNRIFKNIATTLQKLQNHLEIPPYLKTIFDENILSKEEAMDRLKRGMANFDLATITTIHSFCFQALREFGAHEGVWLKIDSESLIQSNKPFEIISDIFQSLTFDDALSFYQKQILLKKSLGSVFALAKKVLSLLSKGIPIEEGPSNEQLSQTLETDINHMKLQGWSSEKWSNAVSSYATLFKGTCEGRTSCLKDEIDRNLGELGKLFLNSNLTAKDLDRLSQCIGVLHLITETNLKARVQISEELLAWISLCEQVLLPPLFLWSHYPHLLVRVGKQAQHLIEIHYAKEGLTDFSDLLCKMEGLAKKKKFQEYFRKQFRLGIIDEFQDTDPIQWRIFQELFLNAELPLILVGDPKQSIYGFRGADIYTYLAASDLIDPFHHYSLTTNYRSSSSLIHAMNTLFNERGRTGWLALPKNKCSLPYLPVKHPKGEFEELTKSSPLVFIHPKTSKKCSLIEIEENYLFPFFINEVEKLHLHEQIPLQQIAFLVRDHRQSDRLAGYLKKRGFPVHQQKNSSLNQSFIGRELLHVLNMLLSPRHVKNVLIALKTSFFRLSLEALEKFNHPDELIKWIPIFLNCFEIWNKKGINSCMAQFLRERLPDKNETVHETLLAGFNGKQNCSELDHWMEWLIDQEKTLKLSPYDLVKALASFLESENFDTELKGSQDIGSSLRVMTMHMSKGLEFEVVFALGVINRTPLPEPFKMIKKENMTVLKAISEIDFEYTDYLEECDAEKARQLYVSLTRAKSKLYIPYVNSLKSPRLGEASPLELFLARRSYPDSSWEELYSYIKNGELDLLDPLKRDKTFEIIDIDVQQSTVSYVKERYEILKPESFLRSFALVPFSSFTSLSKTHKNGSPKRLLQPPSDFTIEKKNCHLLPAGAMTGELIHRLLEEVPFEAISTLDGEDKLDSFVQRILGNSLYHEWSSVIATMIRKTFTTTFFNPEIQLAQLSESDCFREVEFTFSAKHLHHVSELECLNGTVKGVIDFAFVWNEEVYLIDWKTNWLGESSDDYSFDSIRETIVKEGYDLQATIYLEAFKQYLNYFPGYKLKGIFYIFLRGFDAERGWNFIPYD